MDRSVLLEIETSGGECVRKLRQLKSSLDMDELVFNFKSLGSDLVIFLGNSVERQVFFRMFWKLSTMTHQIMLDLKFNNITDTAVTVAQTT